MPSKQKNEIKAVAKEVVSKRNLGAYLQENAYQFEDEDDRRSYTKKAMTEILEYYNEPIVRSDQEFVDRSEKYFIRCIEKGIKPTWEELALALGTTRQSLWEWETGRRGTITPELVKRAKEVMASFDSKAVVDGKLNPVTYIFRAKNYYGMRDQQDVVVTPNTLETRAKDQLIAEAEMLPED